MKDLAKISKLFDVKYGVNLELINLDQCDIRHPDSISFVSRTESNNGVSAIVKKIPGVQPNPGHTLSVAGGGSVLSTFYQSKPFYSGRDLYVLVPLTEMTVMEMLFYSYCIELNKYKYNYGRQANRTLKDILIPTKMPQSFYQAQQDVLNSMQAVYEHARLVSPTISNKTEQIQLKLTEQAVPSAALEGVGTGEIFKKNSLK